MNHLLRTCLAVLLAATVATAHADTLPRPDGSLWQLQSTGFARQESGMPYVGNGYFSQRIPPAGAGYQANVGTSFWPIGRKRGVQAIVAGLYSRGRFSTIYPDMAKRAIVAVPTWSTLDFTSPSGTYSAHTARLADIRGYRQVEDLRSGTVTTSGTWTAPGGEETGFTYRVFVDRARKQIAVVTLTITPHWSGSLRVTSLFDGAGAARMQPGTANVDTRRHRTVLTTRTIGNGVTLAQVAQLRIDGIPAFDSVEAQPQHPMSAGERFTLSVQAGRSYRITKLVGIATSKDGTDPAAAAALAMNAAADKGIAALADENRKAWDAIWQGDIEVTGDAALQTVVRAGLYDLYASVRHDAPGVIGPSGLSSDSYAGMAFWDSDIWMMPALLATHPEVARTLVDYRFDTLTAARRNARANGYRGAFYPWTAADDGTIGEDCYGTVADADNTILQDPNYSCSQEFHLQADIAMAAWDYFEATGNRDWLATRGYPVLAGIADFWASLARPGADGGYAVKRVQPPDEDHHDVDNSAYTNAAASLAIRHAIEAAKRLGQPPHPEWAAVANGLEKTIPFDAADQRHLEYDGYDGSIVKQADVVLMTYPLQYPMTPQVALNDINYYVPRTRSNGPAMTDAIHSIATSALNVPGCAAYTFMVRSYLPQLRMPFYQTSETDEGGAVNFLTGTGGLLQQFYYGFSGLRFGVDAVTLDPSLPPQMKGITLHGLKWQGRTFELTIDRMHGEARLVDGAPMPVQTPQGPRTLVAGTPLVLTTRKPDLSPTTDIARCHRASATSAYAAYPPVGAVDGSLATNWSPVGGQGTLTVDLGRAMHVDGVEVVRGEGSVFAYTVQASADRAHWWRVDGSIDSGDKATQRLPSSAGNAAARYVRLTVRGEAKKEAVRVTEFKVTEADAQAVR